MTNPSLDPWSYKPWWCQPWSIVLTGILLIVGSWLLSHRLWITIVVSLPVVLWMIYFLFLWPKLMKQLLEQASLLSDKGLGATIDPKPQSSIGADP